jgi:NTP pyrophosphatase (non-canonical NTP hydrolase)
MDYSNGLERLWYSSIALHRRFGLIDSPLEGRRRKLSEEYTEFIEASVLHQVSMQEIEDGFTTSDFELRDDVAEELADLFVCVMNVAHKHGLQWRDLDKAFNQVAMKNDNKSELTHAVFDGKIVKRSKLMEIKDGSKNDS